MAVAPGGLVNVEAGTYSEHVNVAQDVTIQGSGAATLQGTSGDGITISAGNVTIKSLNITGFTNGLHVISFHGLGGSAQYCSRHRDERCVWGTLCVSHQPG